MLFSTFTNTLLKSNVVFVNLKSWTELDDDITFFYRTALYL